MTASSAQRACARRKLAATVLYGSQQLAGPATRNQMEQDRTATLGIRCTEVVTLDALVRVEAHAGPGHRAGIVIVAGSDHATAPTPSKRLTQRGAMAGRHRIGEWRPRRSARHCPGRRAVSRQLAATGSASIRLAVRQPTIGRRRNIANPNPPRAAKLVKLTTQITFDRNASKQRLSKFIG